MKRAMHVCPKTGCINLIPAEQRYCEAHAKQQRKPDTRPNSAQRGYDAEWRKIRAAYLEAHPYCVVCGQRATEVDHIVAIREGGTHDWSNLRGMCKSHHSKRTIKDQPGGFVRRDR